MSDDPRPQIAPLLLSQLIDSAPARVRKRLDKEPEIAKSWKWQFHADHWQVACGEESVSLRTTNRSLENVASISCTCLLSPQCFHILACVSILSPLATSDVEAEVESQMEPNAKQISQVSSAPNMPTLLIDEEMRSAAQLAQTELGLLLRVGGRRADLLRQSGLLRAAHRCRAVGLIHLGNLLLRVCESARRQREAANTADAQSLSEGIALALECGAVIANSSNAAVHWVGQARRSFAPSDLRRLIGLCAEPVLTLSGYAGVIVHLQASDSRSKTECCDRFSVSHVRLGESNLVDQAYRGGIDMGNTTLEAAALSRHQLLVQNLTVSDDGRLGKGTATRWLLEPLPTDLHPFSHGTFVDPVADQLCKIFQTAASAAGESRTGWDLIAFNAVVLGSNGAALVVRLIDSGRIWKLRIANDHPSLFFRENLGLLARCPGLAFRGLGRVRLFSVGEVDLLAIAPPRSTTPESNNAYESADSPVALNLPAEWNRICNLGCERLERWHVTGVQRWNEEVVLPSGMEHQRGEFEGSVWDGLEPLRRRQIGIALGGNQGVTSPSSPLHRRDMRDFVQRHQYTAAQLLELTAQTAHGLPINSSQSSYLVRSEFTGPPVGLEQVYLANHLYLRHASLHTQQQLWLMEQ